MSSSSKSGFLSAANIFGFILVVIVNVWANALPLNGKTTAEMSDSYPCARIWALVGIIVKQMDEQSIVLSAGISAVVILVALVAMNLRSALKR